MKHTLSRRWLATLTYRTETGPIGVQHDIEELEEVQDLVECGPDWNALEKIEIVLQTPVFPNATLEEMQHVNALSQAEFAIYLKDRKFS